MNKKGLLGEVYLAWSKYGSYERKYESRDLCISCIILCLTPPPPQTTACCMPAWNQKILGTTPFFFFAKNTFFTGLITGYFFSLHGVVFFLKIVHFLHFCVYVCQFADMMKKVHFCNCRYGERKKMVAAGIIDILKGVYTGLWAGGVGWYCWPVMLGVGVGVGCI